MRDVSQAFLDKLTTSREFGGRLTVRDTRLIFTMRVLEDSLGLSDPSTADACQRGVGFFRVVNYGDDLYYQDVPDPSLASWPNWTDPTIALKAGSRPGVEDIGSSTSRLWYQKANGDVCYRDFGGALGNETVVTSSFASYALTLAPVSTTTCYAHWLDGNWGAIARLHTSLAPITWQGRVYGDCQTARFFDAVQVSVGGDLWHHLYVADNNHGRILTLKTRDAVWSDLTFVVPLDVVDNTSYFKLAYASFIHDKIVLTGRLSRPSDYGAIAFDMYTFGPSTDTVDFGHYSMGRDLYIDKDETGGKMFLVGNKVWYVGTNAVGEADATMLVGVDLASKKLVTQKFSSFQLSCTPNKSTACNVEMDPSVDSALLRRGAEVSLEVALGGVYTDLIKLSIDGMMPAWGTEGEALSIAGRSLSLKRLSRWESDQSYDYWSQAKQSSDPAELEEVIRSSGHWELSGEPLILSQLNVEGVLYLVAKPSRGGLMRAKFYKPAGDFQPLYGVILNYYHETRHEAAARLEKEVKDVADNEIGHNGILALWGEDQHEEGVGIGIYFWRNSVLTKIASGSQAIPDDTWHWLSMTFSDGLIAAHYRTNAGTEWTEVVSTVFTEQTYAPWRRETFGRGGLFINNRTPHSTTPGFTSTSVVIPVLDTTEFPVSETVIVDNEQIEYDGKTSAGLEGTLEWTEGTTLALAVHDNPYFADLTLHSKKDGANKAGIHVGRIYEEQMMGMSIKTRVGSGVPENYIHRMTKAKYRVKKVGNPGPLYLRYTSDAYDNYVVPPTWAIIAYASVPASQIGTSYSWVEWTFDTPWLRPYGYWAFLTVNPPGVSGTYDPDNYYTIEYSGTTFQVLRVWNDPGWTSYSDKHLLFEFIGANRSGDGHEIYIDGAGIETLREEYDNLALAVVEGPGAGTVFTISDYDYQAPRQWEPNREYESPDKWQNHIGDAAHGEWTVPDMSRIFVAEDPSGVVGPGSKFEMLAALKIKLVGGEYQRGLNDTEITSHGSTVVSVYRDLSVKCDRVEFYSLERDWRMEDMIKELGTKAGVADFEFDQALDGPLTFQESTWNAPEWLDERQNFIASFKIPTLGTGKKIGVVFRSPLQPADITTMTHGYRIMLTHDYKLRFSIAGEGNWVLQEVFNFGFVPTGYMTISCQKDAFSVWIGGRYIYTFRDGTWTDGANAGIVSYGAVMAIARWSNVDRLVDNFIFDMGRRGAQLLSELIGPKRIYFHDGANGELKVFRARDDIGDLPDLNFRGSLGEVDMDQISRIRSEGYEVAEVVDWDILKNEGNLFALLNATEANDAWEAYKEGEQAIKEEAAHASIVSSAFAADPRVEPDDLCTITLPDGDHNILVTSVIFTLDNNEHQPVFDMEIGAVDADQL